MTNTLDIGLFEQKLSHGQVLQRRSRHIGPCAASRLPWVAAQSIDTAPIQRFQHFDPGHFTRLAQQLFKTQYPELDTL